MRVSNFPLPFDERDHAFMLPPRPVLGERAGQRRVSNLEGQAGPTHAKARGGRGVREGRLHSITNLLAHPRVRHVQSDHEPD